MHTLISEPRTIIPACDFRDLSKFETLLKATDKIEKIGAYKIGMLLGYQNSLPKVGEVAKKYTSKPLIFDHQKGATDIPDTGADFMGIVAESGFDAVILFPQSGPVTLKVWVQKAMEKGLKLIVGGKMTHEQYVFSEGGFIADEAVEKMYIIAAQMGVVDFVVPGNLPEFITYIRTKIQEYVAEPIFYAPGFVAQGGKISDAAKVAGPKWHAIVGRAIYDQPDMAKAAMSLAASI